MTDWQAKARDLLPCIWHAHNTSTAVFTSGRKPTCEERGRPICVNCKRDQPRLAAALQAAFDEGASSCEAHAADNGRLWVQLRKAEAERDTWRKATGYTDPEKLDSVLGRAGVDHHIDVLAQLAHKAMAERDELGKRLEEREADMHMRIRADYDKSVADSWRAHCAKIEAECDELRAALRNAELDRDAARAAEKELRLTLLCEQGDVAGAVEGWKRDGDGSETWRTRNAGMYRVRDYGMTSWVLYETDLAGCYTAGTKTSRHPTARAAMLAHREGQEKA